MHPEDLYREIPWAAPDLFTACVFRINSGIGQKVVDIFIHQFGRKKNFLGCTPKIYTGQSPGLPLAIFSACVFRIFNGIGPKVVPIFIYRLG